MILSLVAPGLLPQFGAGEGGEKKGVSQGQGLTERRPLTSGPASAPLAPVNRRRWRLGASPASRAPGCITVPGSLPPRGPVPAALARPPAACVRGAEAGEAPSSRPDCVGRAPCVLLQTDLNGTALGQGGGSASMHS